LSLSAVQIFEIFWLHITNTQELTPWRMSLRCHLYLFTKVEFNVFYVSNKGSVGRVYFDLFVKNREDKLLEHRNFIKCYVISEKMTLKFTKCCSNAG